MKETFKNFWLKKYNQYLLITFLSYIIPVSIFGHWDLYNSVYFPISLLLIYFTLNYKWVEGKKWPEYLASGLHGFSVSMFGITIMGMTMEGSVVHISIYVGILVYLVSSLPFIIFSEKYRREKKREYDLSFTDEKSKERDIKLNNILGIRF
jgi:hypothetical protein